jgi:hypothetical protein
MVVAERLAGAADHALNAVVWIVAKAGVLSMQEMSNMEATAPIELGIDD